MPAPEELDARALAFGKLLSLWAERSDKEDKLIEPESDSVPGYLPVFPAVITPEIRNELKDMYSRVTLTDQKKALRVIDGSNKYGRAFYNWSRQGYGIPGEVLWDKLTDQTARNSHALLKYCLRVHEERSTGAA